MNRSRTPFTWLSRLILNGNPKTLTHLKPSLTHNPIQSPFLFLHNSVNQTRRFCTEIDEFERAIQDLLVEVEREKNLEIERKRKAGIKIDDENEEDEDYMGVGPLIEQLDKEIAREDRPGGRDDDEYWSQTDSDSESEEDDDDEERAQAMYEKEEKLIERKINRHKELTEGFLEARTMDEAFTWMSKIDNFEEKHFHLRYEYRVIGELLNRFKESTGKEKFLLAQKLNRAMRLVERRVAFDTNNPANFSVIQQEEVSASGEVVDDADAWMKREDVEGSDEKVAVEEEEEFDDMKERDTILLEKLSAIDKRLEEKLAALDHTFGKKGKLLEEEIRDLAEERNSLTEKKRIPMYRRGFDVHLIDMNRTCKVTKGGQVVKYTAILACGNYNGVVGYAKAKGPAVPIALQKAYEKCFQNLHYVDRYEDHTIAHAIQTTYKKTKVYLWPARTTTGMKAGRTVETILNLAGFKNVKSKVIGSRNAHNTVKAVFQALNAIETPKDVQEKFGRTVVESYLL